MSRETFIQHIMSHIAIPAMQALSGATLISLAHPLNVLRQFLGRVHMKTQSFCQMPENVLHQLNSLAHTQISPGRPTELAALPWAYS